MSVAAILGAGPAGLMAAYACERNGIEPVIFAAAVLPSRIPDDMFLQQPLPDIPGYESGEPDAMLDYDRVGSARGYARICYGNVKAPVSWEHISWGTHGIWWLQEIYEALWQRYEGVIKPRIVGPAQAAVIAGNFSLTLSTLPAPVICSTPEEHQFEEIPTWLVRSSYTSDRTRERYVLTYNGDQKWDAGWFRYSKLRNWHTWEYSKDPRVHFPKELDEVPLVMSGQKFLGTTCDCFPKIHRVGRWAQWKRGVLNHHAFEETTGILASMGLGKGA